MGQGAVTVSGGRYQRLVDALMSAFPTRAQLAIMLEFKLAKKLDEIAEGENHTHRVFELVAAANAGGWTDKLIGAAFESRPKNAKMFAFAQEYGIAFGDLGMGTGMSLERILAKTTSTLDVNIWRERLGEIEGQVCRVELGSDPQAMGTGFLVGRNLLLTAQHVVAPLIAEQASAEDVILRFDYKRLGKLRVVHPGVEHRLAANWLLEASPPSPSDSEVNPLRDPEPGHLDFALLRINGAPGDEKLGGKGDPGAPARGWMNVTKNDHAFAKDSPLFIVQHPSGEPLKLALEARSVVSINGNGTRVRHRTNTEPGSSGSPCFSQDWELVALHHSGEPNDAPTFNQAVPLAKIRDYLAARQIELPVYEPPPA